MYYTSKRCCSVHYGNNPNRWQQPNICIWSSNFCHRKLVNKIFSLKSNKLASLYPTVTVFYIEQIFVKKSEQCIQSALGNTGMHRYLFWHWISTQYRSSRSRNNWYKTISFTAVSQQQHMFPWWRPEVDSSTWGEAAGVSRGSFSK